MVKTRLRDERSTPRMNRRIEEVFTITLFGDPLTNCYVVSSSIVGYNLDPVKIIQFQGSRKWNDDMQKQLYNMAPVQKDVKVE